MRCAHRAQYVSTASSTNRRGATRPSPTTSPRSTPRKGSPRANAPKCASSTTTTRYTSAFDSTIPDTSPRVSGDATCRWAIPTGSASCSTATTTIAPRSASTSIHSACVATKCRPSTRTTTHGIPCGQSRRPWTPAAGPRSTAFPSASCASRATACRRGACSSSASSDAAMNTRCRRSSPRRKAVAFRATDISRDCAISQPADGSRSYPTR